MRTSSNMIKVIVADDHDCILEGFSALVHKHASDSIQVIAHAKNGFELVDLVEEFSPDVVVTDIRMPEMDGLEATKLIYQRNTSSGVIAFSSFDECSLIYDMFEAGAKGFLLKTASKEEMFEAIQVVSAGEMHYSNHTSRSLLKTIAHSKHNKFKKSNIHFSENELAIIRMTTFQMSIKEMAEKTKLSPSSVEDYSKRIREKIGNRNMVGIALYAVKNHIVSIDDL